MYQLSSRRVTQWTCLTLLSLTVAISGTWAGGDNKKPKLTRTEFDKVEKKQYPWGWIRWTLNAECDPAAEMTFGVVYIKPLQENPLHLHPNCAEYLHVTQGECEHLVGTKWITLKKGDTIRIPVNVPHRARTKDQACRAVIVYNTGQRKMVHIKDES